MNAKHARELTERNGSAEDRYRNENLRRIHAMIQEAAESGKSSVLVDLGRYSNGIADLLRLEGYSVKEAEHGPIGTPWQRDAITISW